MSITELIEHLTAARELYGDVEVVVSTDRFQRAVVTLPIHEIVPYGDKLFVGYRSPGRDTATDRPS